MNPLNKILFALHKEGSVLTAREIAQKADVPFFVANQLLISESKKPVPLVELSDLDDGSTGYKFIGDADDAQKIEEISQTEPSEEPKSSPVSDKKPSPTKKEPEAKKKKPEVKAKAVKIEDLSLDEIAANNILSAYSGNKKIKKTKKDLYAASGVNDEDAESAINHLMKENYIKTIFFADFGESVYLLGDNESAITYQSAGDEVGEEPTAESTAAINSNEKIVLDDSIAAKAKAEKIAKSEAESKARAEAKAKAEDKAKAEAEAEAIKAAKEEDDKIAKAKASVEAAKIAKIEADSIKENDGSSIDTADNSKEILLLEIVELKKVIDGIRSTSKPSLNSSAPVDALSSTIQYIRMLESELQEWRNAGAMISSSIKAIKTLSE